MKKLIGLGLILTVATGSAVLPLWLPSSDAQAGSLSSSTAYFRPVAAALPLPDSARNAEPGQPLVVPQTGRVHELLVHDGQRVQSGQVLLKVLVPQASVQQQQLQARLRGQEQAYAALEHQQAPAATLAEARQQLTATRQQLARCVPMFSFSYLTAPAAGIVRLPTGPPSGRVAAGSVIAHLAPLPPADTTLLLTSVE